MWHQQVPHLQQRPSMPMSAEPNSWEDLLDSGYLDQQIGQLSMGGVPPMHLQQQQRRPPLIQHPPLMSIMVPPPHLLGQQPPLSNGYLPMRHHSHVIPPNMVQPAVIAQRPRIQQRAPIQQQPPVQPRPGSYIRQPQMRMNGGIGVVQPIIDTSVPPPRLPSLYQPPATNQTSKPRPSYQQQQPTAVRPAVVATPANKERLTDTDLSSPFASTTPTIKLVGEDEHRTLCPIPGPKVKILKRPSSTPSNLCSGGDELKAGADGSNGGSNGAIHGKNSAAMKSLKQREEEYAQARLRILGSAGTENEST